MTADKLKLNDDKTELIVIGTRAQLDKISISELSIDHVKVSAVCNVRNLGSWFDNHLSMKTAINKTCQSGLYDLHNIGRIKRFLSSEDRKSIVQAIVMSRKDDCNSLKPTKKPHTKNATRKSIILVLKTVKSYNRAL